MAARKKRAAHRRSDPTAARFVAAAGARFTDEEAQIIGTELARIAEENRVEQIRSLDRDLVLSIVERTKDHPLRPFFEWDQAKAARAHRLAQAGVMIRSVRVVHVTGRVPEIPEPLFMYVPDGSSKRGDPTSIFRRTRVLTADAMQDDPIFASALGAMIHNLRLQIRRLSRTTSARPCAPEIVRLASELQGAIDRYSTTVAAAVAAE